MWQMMAGMGGGAAGSVLNSVGQQQGFRALAAAKKKQMAEQDGIQREDNQDLGATIQNNNPLLMEARNAAQAIQPGQEYLERVRTVGPVGLSVSQQVAAAPRQESNMADLQGANERLARLNATEQTQTGLRLSDAQFKDRRGGRESKARRLASLYELLDMQAAQKGEGLRNLGNLITAASGAAGGMGGQGKQPLFTTG
jgi:hypothetical protein